MAYILLIQLCTEYADATGGALFDRLIYVIRDWIHDDTIGVRKGYFDQKAKVGNYVKLAEDANSV